MSIDILDANEDNAAGPRLASDAPWLGHAKEFSPRGPHGESEWTIYEMEKNSHRRRMRFS